MAKKFQPPKSLGQCADLLFDLKAKRLAQQKLVDLVADQEKLLKEYIINTLPKSQASGVAGKRARVSIEVKEVPKVTNWDKLYAHIKKTGEFELLGRSVSKDAIRERWDAKKPRQVPGVEKFPVKTVSLNQL